MPRPTSKSRRRRYRLLSTYALRHWRALILILALTVVTPLLTALSPLPIKLLVDRALSGADVAAGDPMWLIDRLPLPQTAVGIAIAAGVASLTLFALGSVVEGALNFAWALTAQRMVHSLAGDLFHRLQRLSPLFHARHSVGDLLSRITGDSWSVYQVVEGALVSPLRDVLTLVAVMVLAWHIDPAMAWLSLMVAPALAWVAIFFGPRLKRRAEMHRQVEARLFGFVHQTLGAISLVQASAAQQRTSRTFGELAGSAVKLTQQGSLLKNTYSSFTGLITTLGTAAVLIFGARRVLLGLMSLGDLLVFIAYLRTMHGSAQGLLRVHGALKSAEAGLDRVSEILYSAEHVMEPPGAVSLPPSAAPPSISLEAVEFGYALDRPPVLRRLTLDVRAGEVVAVIGRTGAGKSTLAALVARLFDPWSGRVLLDGRDVRDLTLASVRGRVAVVPQESLLLPLSIGENIAYGMPEADAAMIESAADAAGALEFIRQLPQGMQTVMGERGCTLSAGQRQRVAIARALLLLGGEAGVLLLDEPTSALDVHTERSVMQAIARLKGRFTVILIAHRLSTTRCADRVVVLQDGGIAREGTPDEILGGDGELPDPGPVVAEVSA